jgi:DNA polymerase delta subunit 1
VGGIISIELVHKRSLWGYLGDDHALFMKVTVTQPRIVPRVRDEWRLFPMVQPLSYLPAFLRAFENGEVSFRGLFSGPVTTFESNIPYTLRFMIDTKVRPIEDSHGSV